MMKKIIGKLLAATLLGAVLIANAQAGGWISVSGTADSDGLLLITSKWNTTITGETSTDGSNYVQRFTVSKRDSYGQGYTSASMPVAKGECWQITGAQSIWFFRLEGSDGQDGLDGKVTIIESAVGDLTTEIERINGELATIKGQLVIQGSDLISIRNELISYGDSLTYLQEQLTIMQGQQQGRIDDLAEVIDGVQNEINAQVVALVKRLDEIERRLSALEQRAGSSSGGKQSNDLWGKAGFGLGAAGVGIAVGQLVSDDENRDEQEPAGDCGAVSEGIQTRPGFTTGN